jgi:YHS domain-containing protein
MFDLASSSSVAPPNSDTVAAADKLEKELADRFVTLIDNAEVRIRGLQKKAASEFTRRQERLAQFAATRERGNRIINDRLGVLTAQSQSNDGQFTYSDGVGCTAGAQCNGSLTTVTFPKSSARQKRLEISFDVFHDSDVDHAVVGDRIQILPVFVKFVSHDQLSISFDGPTDSGVVAWVGAKLVGFAETYFDVFFYPEYQKPNMVVDPVTGMPFPNAMAAGVRKIDGKTLYFFTDESCRQFDTTPSYYLGTRSGSIVEPKLQSIAFTQE